MSINTQAILSGHLTIGKVCELLAAVEGVAVIGDHEMHRPDYKMVAFRGPDGRNQSMDVFLNSYAAEDYRAAFIGESTLISLPFSPENFNVVLALARSAGGLVRRIDRESWNTVASDVPLAE